MGPVSCNKAYRAGSRLDNIDPQDLRFHRQSCTYAPPFSTRGDHLASDSIGARSRFSSSRSTMGSRHCAFSSGRGGMSVTSLRLDRPSSHPPWRWATETCCGQTTPAAKRKKRCRPRVVHRINPLRGADCSGVMRLTNYEFRYRTQDPPP